jgi:hypothetical protein
MALLSLRRKMTGGALHWGVGCGRVSQQTGATSVAGATIVAPLRPGGRCGAIRPGLTCADAALSSGSGCLLGHAWIEDVTDTVSEKIDG